MSDINLAYAIIAVAALGAVWILIDCVRSNRRHVAQPIPKKPHEIKREAQIAALLAAVPSIPPERLRATIHVNTVTFIGRRELDSVYQDVEMMRYSVDMVLELSEQMREILNYNLLHSVTIESLPKFSSKWIERALIEFKHGRHPTPFSASGYNKMRSEMRAAKEDIQVGDYLQVPYSREFDSLPEAQDYSDRLKTVVLPKIRDLIDRAGQHREAETVEF